MVADRLDPPEARVVGTAQNAAEPGEAVAVASPGKQQPPRPEIGGIDLGPEDDDERHRRIAALRLVGPDIKGWLLVSLRERSDGTGGISVKGFVPTYAYGAFAETMRRAKDALIRQ